MQQTRKGLVCVGYRDGELVCKEGRNALPPNFVVGNSGDIALHRSVNTTLGFRVFNIGQSFWQDSVDAVAPYVDTHMIADAEFNVDCIVGDDRGENAPHWTTTEVTVGPMRRLWDTSVLRSMIKAHPLPSTKTTQITRLMGAAIVGSASAQDAFTNVCSIAKACGVSNTLVLKALGGIRWSYDITDREYRRREAYIYVRLLPHLSVVERAQGLMALVKAASPHTIADLKSVFNKIDVVRTLADACTSDSTGATSIIDFMIVLLNRGGIHLLATNPTTELLTVLVDALRTYADGGVAGDKIEDAYIGSAKLYAAAPVLWQMAEACNHEGAKQAALSLLLMSTDRSTMRLGTRSFDELIKMIDFEALIIFRDTKLANIVNAMGAELLYQRAGRHLRRILLACVKSECCASVYALLPHITAHDAAHAMTQLLTMPPTIALSHIANALMVRMPALVTTIQAGTAPLVPDLPVGAIERIQNQELRVIMMGLKGTENYVKDAEFKVVHTDKWGTLMCRNEGTDREMWVVKVLNSTPEPDGSRKEYFLRLGSRNLDGRRWASAHEAVAATFNLRPEQYNPEIES